MRYTCPRVSNKVTKLGITGAYPGRHVNFVYRRRKASVLGLLGMPATSAGRPKRVVGMEVSNSNTPTAIHLLIYIPYRSPSGARGPHQGGAGVPCPTHYEVTQRIFHSQWQTQELHGGYQWQPDLLQPTRWEMCLNDQSDEIRWHHHSKGYTEVGSYHEWNYQARDRRNLFQTWARACCGSKNLQWNGRPCGVKFLAIWLCSW